MTASSGYEATRLLIEERPDLVPHLKRCLATLDANDGGTFDDVPQDALDEFVRRGLIVLSDLGAAF